MPWKPDTNETPMRKPKLLAAPPAIIVHPHPDTPIRDLARAAYTLGIELRLRLAPRKKPKAKPRKGKTHAR